MSKPYLQRLIIAHGICDRVREFLRMEAILITLPSLRSLVSGKPSPPCHTSTHSINHCDLEHLRLEQEQLTHKYTMQHKMLRIYK